MVVPAEAACPAARPEARAEALQSADRKVSALWPVNPQVEAPLDRVRQVALRKGLDTVARDAATQRRSGEPFLKLSDKKRAAGFGGSSVLERIEKEEVVDDSSKPSTNKEPSR